MMSEEDCIFNSSSLPSYYICVSGGVVMMVMGTGEGGRGETLLLLLILSFGCLHNLLQMVSLLIIFRL